MKMGRIQKRISCHSVQGANRQTREQENFETAFLETGLAKRRAVRYSGEISLGWVDARPPGCEGCGVRVGGPFLIGPVIISITFLETPLMMCYSIEHGMADDENTTY